MSACHVLGNVAFNNHVTTSALGGVTCSCSCHNPVWFSVTPPICWCNCNNKYPASFTIVSNNDFETQKEISVLRETLNKIQDKVRSLEDKLKAALHNSCLCDLCNGAGIFQGTYNCPKCEGTGEYASK